MCRPRALGRNRNSARVPGSEQFAGRSLRAGDCPDGRVCATPERLDHQRQTHDAEYKPGVVPDLATCPQPQPSADRPTDRSEHEAASAPAGSFGSPPSHVTPNVATTACPSDISTGDAGDISIGDLQPLAAAGRPFDVMVSRRPS